MENDPGLLVHLINFTLQIAAVVFALRMIPLSGRARAWLILSCSFMLTAVHRLLEVFIHMTNGWQMLELNDVVVTFSALLLVAGIYLLRGIFEERQEAQQQLQQQLDKLLRFQKVSVGRELRMKELVKENTALRSAAPPAKLTVHSHERLHGRPAPGTAGRATHHCQPAGTD